MPQNDNTIAQMTKAIVSFRDERDWAKFHNLKDMAISLNLEATEVLELWQWKTDRVEIDKTNLAHELSDVLWWVLLMAHDAGIDLESAFYSKLAHTAAKYPVEKCMGKATKYTDL